MYNVGMMQGKLDTHNHFFQVQHAYTVMQYQRTCHKTVAYIRCAILDPHDIHISGRKAGNFDKRVGKNFVEIESWSRVHAF